MNAHSVQERPLAEGDPNKLLVPQLPIIHQPQPQPQPQPQAQHSPNAFPGSPAASQGTAPSKRHRERYNDEMRTEVAKVREIGACEVCHRRKVKCQHVRDEHAELFTPNHKAQGALPSVRKNKKPKRKAPSSSTEANDTSPPPKAPRRQQSIPVSLFLSNEDDPAGHFAPQPQPQSESPEVQSQQRTSSLLSNLSEKLPAQWQEETNYLPASVPAQYSTSIYPTQVELPSDLESRLSSGMTSAGYEYWSQTLPGTYWGFQGQEHAFASGNTDAVLITRTASPTQMDGDGQIPAYADVTTHLGARPNQRQNRPAPAPAVTQGAYANAAPIENFHFTPPPSFQQMTDHNPLSPTNYLSPFNEYAADYNNVAPASSQRFLDTEGLNVPSLYDGTTTNYWTVLPQYQASQHEAMDSLASASFAFEEFEYGTLQADASTDVRGMDDPKKIWTYSDLLNATPSPEPEIT